MVSDDRLVSHPERLVIERSRDVPIAHTISMATGAGQRGDPLGHARASLVALRRHGTVYADEAGRTPLFGWRASWPFLAANQFTVTDAGGPVLAMFAKTVHKTFRAARINLVTPDGVDAIGRDAGALPGVVKMFAGHRTQVSFRFTVGDADVLVVERGWDTAAPYTVECPSFGDGRRLDWRVASAVAIVMDVTLNRSSF